MQYTLIQQLPGRIRLRLNAPHSPWLETTSFQNSLLQFNGVVRVQYNWRTRQLLVLHSSDLVMHQLLEWIGTCRPFILHPVGRQASELRLSQRKFLIALALLLGKRWIPDPLKPWSVLISAFPIIRKGLGALLHRKISGDVLDSAAIGVAMSMKDFHTANIISTLLAFGNYLEVYTKHRARRGMEHLLAEGGLQVWVRREGQEVQIPIDQVKVEDQVVVRAGSAILVDGLVVQGEALVNQASMTGEPLPVLKRPGSSVYAGTALQEGRLIIQVEGVGSSTRIARMIKVIEESEAHKGAFQSRSEALADRLVAPILALSGLTYLLTHNPLRAAAVLLVDFSCAIKLSTPLAILAAMVASSKRGILIKGGKYVENLASANVFVFDKTGTLTHAHPRVVRVVGFHGHEPDFILKNAACLEEHFPHPVATAVVKAAHAKGLRHEELHDEVEHIAAHGLATRLLGKRVLLGSRHFVHEDNHIDVSMADQELATFSALGHSCLYMAMEDQLVGVITLSDPVRKESAQVIGRLRELGVDKVIMLTGDHHNTASSVAKQLQIQHFQSQVLPEDKKRLIDQLRTEGHKVAMVGDGMNDSAALSWADVGISLKHGAELAKEAADVILLNGRLESLPHARTISQTAVSRIQRNYRAICLVNGLLIVAGMLGISSPLSSALGHNLTTVLVSLHSLQPYHQ